MITSAFQDISNIEASLWGAADQLHAFDTEALRSASGDVFVQSSHFIEHEGRDTMSRVTFYGQERAGTTIRLARMNLAVLSSSPA